LIHFTVDLHWQWKESAQKSADCWCSSETLLLALRISTDISANGDASRPFYSIQFLLTRKFQCDVLKDCRTAPNQSCRHTAHKVLGHYLSCGFNFLISFPTCSPQMKHSSSAAHDSNMLYAPSASASRLSRVFPSLIALGRKAKKKIELASR
jgi:hypothetical protein